ncbi:RrF2 family transcriptional regulator [Isachenkonia alkalipeptolytica]|uniref:Rrf2 family transcriptional regulator n=1 Tax=Isachenkonia alkalipeptolytica TaxID=2565777 RepID=A0AA43XK27_9CLOT|nr:Rrf2 family transcriptional regulator [Isachenkonia alkalipeptolytica]NBG87624.1 Rrf2 family transcriptional regulator [Isachenkonia alkalipeptolytica]
MKFSTKGRYGLKAMFDLAMNYGDGPITLKNIAQRQDISEHYLEQLIATLRRAKLVKSVRGAQGGYMLNHPPEEITVGAIIRSLEGPVGPADCVMDADSEECRNQESCVTRLVWARIQESVNDVIDTTTLAHMLEDQEKINNKKNYMFYI